MLSRLVIAFLPRSKCLLISWLQSPSAVILEPKRLKSVTVSIVSPFICHGVMGPDAMILVFECWVLSQLYQVTKQADSLPAEPPGKPRNTGVGSLSLLQWIFLTQELNLGLLHCRWILYQLGYQDIPEGMIIHSSILSCLENSMDRGAWQATVRGVAKSQMRVSD